MFNFSTYRPNSLKHLFYLSANFGMPDAKNDADCCPCHWSSTDCSSVYDTNFCSPSIFLHQTWTVHFVTHLVITWWFKCIRLYTGCVSQWIWFAFIFLAHKNTITAHCSLRENFSGSFIVSNVYKWRHSDVIIIKLTVATQN